MSRKLTVGELRESPDQLINALDQGESVAITRDGSQIATASPVIVHRGTHYPFRGLNISPLSRPLDVDPVDELIAERERERSDKTWRS